MADTIEKPVLESTEGDTSPKTDDKPTTEQTDSLIEALKDAGVTTADQLDGKLQASQQYGHMQNLLGDVRAENTKLVETIQNMQTSNTPAQQTNIDDMGEGQQVDLQSLVVNSVRTVLKEEKDLQARVQNASLQQYQKITSDKNYSRVGKIWEDKMKDPQVMVQINSGQRDAVDIYRDVVDDFKDGLLKQSLDTITALSGKTVVPPHTVEGAAVAHQLPEDKSESQEVIDNLSAKVEKGKSLTEQEQLAALNATLGGT